MCEDVAGCAKFPGHGYSGAASRLGAAARRRIIHDLFLFLSSYRSPIGTPHVLFASQSLVVFPIENEESTVYNAYVLLEIKMLVDFKRAMNTIWLMVHILF